MNFNPTEKNWYHLKPLKLHWDWHQPEWLKRAGRAVTPELIEEQAQQIRDAGFESVSFFCFDHHGYALYPSKIAPKHPHFKADYPDLLCKALSRQGIRKVGYLSVLSSITLAKKHPDWMVTAADGSHPHFGWLTYEESWICAASPYFEEFFFPLVKEILTRYPLDGLWLDALCWASDTPCYCSACQKNFKAMSGKKIPPAQPRDLSKLSSRDRETQFQWYVYRHRLVIEFHERIQKIVKQINPGIVVMDNNIGQPSRPMPLTKNGKFVRWLGLEEIPVDAFSCDPVPAGGNHEIVLSYYAKHQVTAGKPFDYMNERFHCWGEWQTRSAIDWDLEFRTILANGASPYFADNPNPDGTIEKEIYEEISTVNQNIRTLRDFSLETEMIPDVGIFLSPSSQIFGLSQHFDKHRLITVPDLSDRLMGAHLAFQELGVQSHILDEVSLERFSKQLGALFVIEQEALSETAIERFEAYVKQGGTLVLVGGSGLFNEKLEARKKWPFEKIAGLAFQGEHPSPVNYFGLSKLFYQHSDLLHQIPIQCRGRAYRFKALSAERLADFYGPLAEVWKSQQRRPSDYRHHTVTGACPRESFPEGGSIFKNKFGKGTVITLSMDPFTRYSVEGHRQLRGLIESVLGIAHPLSKRMMICQHKPLHIETHFLKDGARFQFHAINYFSQKRRGNMVVNEALSLTDPFMVKVKVPPGKWTVQDESNKIITTQRTKQGYLELRVESFRTSLHWRMTNA